MADRGFRARPALPSDTLGNYARIPQAARLTAEKAPGSGAPAIEVVGHVLPFKTNNYVVEQLINWEGLMTAIFILNFPQREMLRPSHYEQMESALAAKDPAQIERTAQEIRLQLNPHPAGQISLNVPKLRDRNGLDGMQHKYPQTVLFFPSQGQTCHAYCAFCFRWPQFVGMDNFKFAMREADMLVRYLQEHKEVTDVLFTGGDPMMMRASVLRQYFDALLAADLPHIQTIRVGTKALAYWPYKFLTDPDAEETLELFRRVFRSGRHLAFMAHFNHPTEMRHPAVREAVPQNPIHRRRDSHPVSHSPPHQRLHQCVGLALARADGIGHGTLLHVRRAGHGGAALFCGAPGRRQRHLPRRAPPRQRHCADGSGTVHVRHPGGRSKSSAPPRSGAKK